MATKVSRSGKLNRPASRSLDRKRVFPAYQTGFSSALIATIGGVVYFLVILGAILTGNFTFPPPDAIQLFGGITSLLFPPVLVILIASLHAIAPLEKKVFSQISLGFTLLFAVTVSINRFTQLGVVRQSMAAGATEGIGWFLPYGERSIMFGLEMLGWDWFLGLAMLFAAPIFSKGRLQHWLRGLLILYGVLGIFAAVAFLLASPLSVIGFVDWGVVLVIVTALMAVFFLRREDLR